MAIRLTIPTKLMGYRQHRLLCQVLLPLKAAAHPADTRYLYFVADGTGDISFLQRWREHNKAVAQYRRYNKDNYEKQQIYCY